MVTVLKKDFEVRSVSGAALRTVLELRGVAREERVFSIAGVCKDDLRKVFARHEGTLRFIDAMTEEDMASFARLVEEHLGDAIVDDAQMIFEERFLRGDAQ